MCAVCEKRQIGPDGHRIVAPMSATASRVPPMISAASAPVPWQDTAQGVGTLLAVFVAVAAFLWEALRARRLEKERDVALAQQARRDQRAAAGAVFALVVDRYTPDAERSSYTREALVHVGNEGNHPVFNVMVSVGVGFYTRTIGPLSVPKPIPVMPARQTLTWDITVPLAAHDDTQSPTAQIGFTDTDGHRWFRHFDGTLVETTGQVAQALETDESETVAREQMGRMEDRQNPLAVAMAFLNQIMAEPGAFVEDDFRSLLAPEADGWTDFTVDQVPALRQDLGEYGVGTMPAYPAPYVAHVKIVKSKDAIGKVIAGEGMVIEAKIITLTYSPERGWRVYGFGLPLAPDSLLFPPGTF